MTKYYIGIDVGGTFIKGGIVDENGNISADGKIATECKRGGDNVSDNIAALINDLIEKSGVESGKIVGVGMGVPGYIDSKRGVVVYAGNLSLSDYHIAEEVKKRAGFDVKVANDANVAALGEKKFGSGKEFNDLVLITLGTGVGAGVIIDGKLFEGNRSAGTEIGHEVIVFGGEKCTCGRAGCFEAYASANALIRDTIRAMNEHKDSKMWEIGSTENVTGKTAFDYASTDECAAKVVDRYEDMLACGITNVANAFRPEAILIGGGVSAQGDNLIVPLTKKVEAQLFGYKFGSPSVILRIASLGNKAGTLGAAALLM